MKKLISMLLCLLLASMLGAAMAAEYEPGEEITITLSINEVDGGGAAYVWYDASGCPLTCVGSTVDTGSGNIVQNPPNGLKMKFGVIKADGVVPGRIGTVTFRVSDNAKPGSYSISVWGELAAASVSGSCSFSIPGCAQCTPGEGEVTKKPTCRAEGERTYKCTRCGEVCKTEILAKANHDYTDEIITLNPTCTEDGVKAFACTMCGDVLKTETLPSTGHQEGELIVTKEASCVEAGIQQSTCTACGTLMKIETMPALGHVDDGGAVTTEPACEEEGTRTYKCSICGLISRTEAIPATGHQPGASKVTKEPTCTETGLSTCSCAVCGKALEDEVMPALGHRKDAGVVVIAPTCTSGGVMSYKCAVCGAALGNTNVDMLPHPEDKGTLILPPTCTEMGRKVIKCTVCGVEIRTDDVPPLGHVSGEWVVTKPSTESEDGLKALYCSVCGELMTTAVIPSTVWYHMTVSSIGPRFRDVIDLTDDWNMFTVVDLSVDGEQTFDLIAGDIHVVGAMTVKVQDGKVTVTYSLNNKETFVKNESLSIVSGLDAITSLEELPAFKFGEEISIADQLGGDIMVVIFVKNTVYYESNGLALKAFTEDPGYTKLVEEMLVNAK